LRKIIKIKPILISKLNSNKKQEKTAGIISGIVKKNLKHNKFDMGLSFATGYLKRKNIGDGVESMANEGMHLAPGVSINSISESFKNKPIKEHQGDRAQINDELKKIKKQAGDKKCQIM
jgi:hypothetical protein